MILTNRLFEREAPIREAKSIYIFCEGGKREYQYFKYFKEMDSRINVEIYKLHPHEGNSPFGLLNIAKSCIIANKDNPNLKYSFLKNDEVWIVLDTDKDKLMMYKLGVVDFLTKPIEKSDLIAKIEKNLRLK